VIGESNKFKELIQGLRSSNSFILAIAKQYAMKIIVAKVPKK
jgi:hypothetical protein